MDLSTNAPGLQVYSGNNLNGSIAGKGAYLYQQYGGIALESQVRWGCLALYNLSECLHRAWFKTASSYFTWHVRMG